MSGKFCYSRIALNKLKCRIRLKMGTKTKSGPRLWQDQDQIVQGPELGLWPGLGLDSAGTRVRAVARIRARQCRNQSKGCGQDQGQIGLGQTNAGLCLLGHPRTFLEDTLHQKIYISHHILPFSKADHQRRYDQPLRLHSALQTEVCINITGYDCCTATIYYCMTTAHYCMATSYY